MKILIADKSRSSAMEIQLSLGKEYECVGLATNYEEAFQLIDSKQPDIVLMNMNMALVMVNNIFSFSFATIAIADEAKPEYLRMGIEIKARDLLVKPLNAETLNDALGRIKLSLQRERLTTVPEESALPGPKEAKLISVVSAKGGVGKSFIAANLAVDLRLTTRQPVILIDLVPGMGTIPLLMDVPVGHTLHDLIESKATGSLEEIEHALIHHKSGVRILAAPLEFCTIDSTLLEEMINTLKKSFRYIIVDTDYIYSTYAQKVMQLSDYIAYLMTFTIPAIRNANIGLELLKSLNIDPFRIKIIANLLYNCREISQKEVEEHLKRKIAVVLPEAAELAHNAVNTGEPLLLSDGDKEINIKLKLVTQLFLERDQVMRNHDGKRRTGWF